MNLTDKVIPYFENLAVQMKEIDHNPLASKKKFFFNDDIGRDTEFSNAIRSGIGETIMILVNPPGALGDINSSDNWVDDMLICLWIVTSCEPTASSRRAGSHKCKNIIRKLVNRMRLDKRKRVDGAMFFQGIERTVEYEPIFLKGDKYIGFEIKLHCQLPYDYNVNNNDWKDLS